MSLYRAKHAAEQALQASGLAWTIRRAPSRTIASRSTRNSSWACTSVTTLSLRRSFPAGVGPPALPGFVIREGTRRSLPQTRSTTSRHTFIDRLALLKAAAASDGLVVLP
jgi:hypothetical protein